MQKRARFGRRVAAAVALGVALFAVTGGGASAAVSTTLPKIVNGKANALTLRIRLQVAPQLALGLPNPLGSALSNIEQVISLTNANVHRTAKLTGNSSGLAVVGSGLLDLGSVTSGCPGATCGVLQSVEGIRIPIPGGIGEIRALGADSMTKNLIDTRNSTALVKVVLNPLGSGPLKPVADALQTALVDPVNAQLIPVVDDALQQVKQNITDPIFKSLPQELQDAVTIGHVRPIPNIVDTNLLSLTIKEAVANVVPTTFGGRTAMQAVATSDIADLSVLGRYVSLGAARLKAVATANGVRGGADSEAVSDIVDLKVGGDLLGIHITPDTLEFLTQNLDQVVANLGPVANLVKILETTAGVTIERFGTSEFASPDGLKASASAGTLKITVEPKIPDPTSLVDSIAAGLDPAKVKYSSAGVKLSVELPTAEAAIALGDVLPKEFSRPARTGLGTGTYALAGVLMLGAAVMVKRFALR